MTCALCDHSTSTVLELAPTPPANELPCDPASQDFFPLNLVKCDFCHHLQLDFEVPKERLFKDYKYISNTGESNRRHFKDYAEEIASLYKPSHIVDVGSNDGLFLSYFPPNTIKLGVDPAASGDQPFLKEFFNEKAAAKIEKVFKNKADIITCNNMFAHNRDLSEILKGVRKLLSPDGTFIFEVSYALDLLENNLFDLLYHEHFHHWHLTPMIEFFKKFGLNIQHADRISTHGGSIRVFATHDDDKAFQTNGLRWLLNYEQENFFKLVGRFADDVNLNRQMCIDTLKNLKQVCPEFQMSILGYPAKACTLSYFYGLDKSLITDVFDDNELKIGCFSHLGFKIRPTSEIAETKPTHLLILSWNYKDQIMQKVKELGFDGWFIVPFPEMRFESPTSKTITNSNEYYISNFIQ